MLILTPEVVILATKASILSAEDVVLETEITVATAAEVVAQGLMKTDGALSLFLIHCGFI
jgi:hypothetical protein